MVAERAMSVSGVVAMHPSVAVHPGLRKVVKPMRVEQLGADAVVERPSLSIARLPDLMAETCTERRSQPRVGRRQPLPIAA